MPEFLKLNRYLTLKRRQMLIIVGVSASILSITSIAFFYNDYITLKRNISDNLSHKATFIGANLTSALVFGDKVSAQQGLEVAGADQTILLGALYNEDKELFSLYARAGQLKHLPEAFPNEGVKYHEDVASVLHPIKFQGNLVGWIYLVHGLSDLEASLNRYAKIVLIMFAVGLLIAWAMSTLSQKFITQPIIELATLVENIRLTKDYNKRMYIDRHDEIGVLIKGFNNMLATIQDRESELQRHGERLESLVELRTKQLHHRANYDALTQLPNRYLLMEKLHQAIESARRTNRYMALLLIDLDRFKIINDSLGHHVGDELLQTLAKRLSRIGRLDDCVGRLGGDEFVILLGNITSPEDAEFVANKVMAEFAEPLQLQNHRLHMSASIGISVFPDDAEDAVGLLRRADISMYRSKAKGQGTYSFYNSAQDNTDQRLMLESKLRHAMENQELYMVYQPQICTQTNKITGVEALMRWYSPELGEIYPTQFIAVAEEIGVINQFTDWALDRVCQQQRLWQQQGASSIKVAVNVSASDLLIADFVEKVRKKLALYDLRPECLELEITEDVFLDRTEQIIDTLRQLKSMGVLIAIDDFGTGYSSLSYLQHFPVDVLKLDGSFIRNIQDSEKSRGIVESTVSLAHGLGLQIVAECVETEFQYEFLHTLGCDIIQGYYFSEALLGDALAIFLNQYQGTWHHDVKNRKAS